MTRTQSADLLAIANRIMRGETTVADGAALLHIRYELMDGGQRVIEYAESTADAARALRAIPSKRRSEASRQNGKRGGRPRKDKPA